MWKRLLSSKKTIAMLAGAIFSMIVVPIADELGADISVDQVYQVIAVIVAYIVGQGVADTGKEATKIATEAGTLPPPILPRRPPTLPPDPTGVTRDLPLIPPREIR